MRSIKNGALILAGILILMGCSENPTSPEDNTGTLSINLTDAPAAYEAVNITFSEIAAHIDSDWVVVRTDPVTVNLLDWNNGQSIEIGRTDVPAGHYTQIRIKIDDSEVLVNGQNYSMTVPSGAQTGLKLGPEFDVNSGSTYTLMVDFDAHRSVVPLGPPGNPNGYVLKPTIRVVPTSATGSISGTVDNPQDLPMAYAISGGDTLTSAAVDTTSGVFMLTYLTEGSYTVAISDTMGLSFSASSVDVVAGSDQDLGVLTLQ